MNEVAFTSAFLKWEEEKEQQKEWKEKAIGITKDLVPEAQLETALSQAIGPSSSLLFILYSCCYPEC